MVVRMLRVHLRDRIPADSDNRFTRAYRLRDIYFDRIHTCDMVDHDADCPAIFWYDSLPFSIGEGLSQVRQFCGTLLQSFSQFRGS